MIKQMWPYIGQYAKDLLKNSVEPAVQNSLPNTLKPFKFERIDLGDIVSKLLQYTYNYGCACTVTTPYTISIANNKHSLIKTVGY